MIKTVKTEGTGSLSLKPDLIRLNMTISGVRPEYDAVMQMSAEQSGALSGCFRGIGFGDEDIKTRNFSISTEYESRRNSDGNYDRVFVGYSFRQELWIEFDADNAMLGRVLTALSKCPAVPEFRIEYTLRDRESASLELLDNAVADARRKAERLAKAAGMKGIMKAQDVIASGCEPDMVVRPFGNMMLAKCAAESASPDITPEDINIIDTVTVVWQIVD